MGVIPNRTDDLARPRARKGKEFAYEVARIEAIEHAVTIPEPDPDWCSAASMIWNAALDSPARCFYESTDWATLYLTCDQINHLYAQGGRRSPEFLRVVMQSLGSLLFTEGDRRRARVEIARVEEGPDYAAQIVGVFPRAIES